MKSFYKAICVRVCVKCVCVCICLQRLYRELYFSEFGPTDSRKHHMSWYFSVDTLDWTNNSVSIKFWWKHSTDCNFLTKKDLFFKMRITWSHPKTNKTPTINVVSFDWFKTAPCEQDPEHCPKCRTLQFTLRTQYMTFRNDCKGKQQYNWK